MAPLPLTYRLQALADSNKQTLNLIQDLQRFPNGALFSTDPNPDEKRLEIANEIHQNLKDLEDSLDFLRQEVEEDTSSIGRRAYLSGSEDQDRNAATLARLSEDIRSARAAFRRAQLQAKRNADTAKRKEREELFADRLNSEQATSRREGQKKLTQDEIALNAAEDVTKSLRRTHELLAGNLQQSQFAQQTLEESQNALKSLADSYGGTSSLLKSSRGLVSQLVRSQKSDTWFLMSSFYLLAVTIAWLVFRRLLYGPMWWFIWQPVKLMWYFTFASLGALGFGGSSKAVSSNGAVSNLVGSPPPGIELKSVYSSAKGGELEQPEQSQVIETTKMVDEVGKIAEEAQERTFLKERNPEVSPTNSKKRMYEETIRDEL